ncbi:MAG: hypothetical protein LBV72_09720 [Tannerella sp.]|nr:hypothetical protein [Tannerella sp.]
MLITICIIIFCIGFPLLLFQMLRASGSTIPASIGGTLFWCIYLLAIPYFVFTTVLGADYNEAIDPIDNKYNAFCSDHTLTLFMFLLIFYVSLILLNKKRKQLPPLAYALCMAFLIIGIAISFIVILQVSGEYEDREWSRDGGMIAIYPIMNILLALWCMYKAIEQEITNATARQYKNKILNYLNSSLTYSARLSVWVVFLLVPAFAIVTVILMLFGQDSDSMIKAFTETATWNFSRHEPLPYLDHEGHYLCTVAACGHPKIVKPLRLGIRHGHEIIVNRQLMVANAYEEMIQDFFPHFHRFIRHAYDKYGYPLSKHIIKPIHSDITYILMKPLEWFFLINLYLFCTNPEVKIKKQYSK